MQTSRGRGDDPSDPRVGNRRMLGSLFGVASGVESVATSGCGGSRRPAQVAMLVGWIPTVVFGVALPLLSYSLLRGHLGEAGARSCAAVWPLALVAGTALVRHRVDELAVLSVALHAVGVVVALVFGASWLLAVKGAAGTGLSGIGLLGSLLAERPAMFWLGRRFATDGSAAAGRRWDGLWRYRSFRRANRLMTAVWGVALLSEAGLRVLVVAWCPVPVAVIAGHALPTAVIGGLIIVTGIYGARVRRANVPAGVAAPSPARSRPGQDANERTSGT